MSHNFKICIIIKIRFDSLFVYENDKRFESLHFILFHFVEQLCNLDKHLVSHVSSMAGVLFVPTLCKVFTIFEPNVVRLVPRLNVLVKSCVDEILLDRFPVLRNVEETRCFVGC